MNKVDVIYEKMVKITNEMFEDNELDNYEEEVKDSIRVILASHNDFILEDSFIKCMAYVATDYYNDYLKFQDLLDTFLDDNLIHNIYSFVDLYTSVYYIYDTRTEINPWQTEFDIDEVPLLNDYVLIQRKLEEEYPDPDCFVFRDIIATIIAYCVINNKQDEFKNLCNIFLENPRKTVDDFVVNGLIEKRETDHYKIYKYRTIPVREEEEAVPVINFILSKFNNKNNKRLIIK